ncbi:hypothetical protein ACFL2A_02080 [Thermodesulfobacteriota bacterium]
MKNFYSQLISILTRYKSGTPLFIICIAALFSLTFPKLSHSVQYAISGDYDVRVINLDNADDLDNDSDDNITYGDLRFRLKSEFSINENVKGVVSLESGYNVFGVDSDSSSSESVPGSDSIDLKLKNAYADFIFPNSEGSFIVGLQPINIFHGLIANEDAFGITYQLHAERDIQVSFVKIDENRVNDDYLNEGNQDRTSSFMSIYYEDIVLKVEKLGLLFGLYEDRDAVINNFSYTKRMAYYGGLSYGWEKFGFDYDLRFIYAKGKKKFRYKETKSFESKESEGFLTDIIVKREFDDFDVDFEFLLATGDINSEDDKDGEFMSIDGLVNYYDRAYIMTGNITKDDSDSKVGVFDSEVRTLQNVVFYRLATSIKVSNSKRLDVAAMYATNDKKIVNADGEESDEIGTEVDVTFSADLSNAEYNKDNGLMLNIFGAYFVPGTNYNDEKGNAADIVYLLGTGLEYTF